jgi:two-component system sensor histidine kinase KdpD
MRRPRMVPVERSGTLRASRPSLGLGIATSLIAVAAATGAIYPLKGIAPVVSLSVVYLPAVLLVSAYWGLALGIATALLSAACFNFFHLPPVGRFTIADSRNWWALGAFALAAAVVSTMAELARSRAVEAERRSAEALALSSVTVELGMAEGDARRQAVPLCDTDGHQVATLLVPRRLDSETSARERARRTGARCPGRDRAAARCDAGGSG